MKKFVGTAINSHGLIYPKGHLKRTFLKLWYVPNVGAKTGNMELMVWIISGLLILTGIVLAVSDTVAINVSVAESSYTKAFGCRQDYYIECQNGNLVNITPVGEPIMLPTNYTNWC